MKSLIVGTLSLFFLSPITAPSVEAQTQPIHSVPSSHASDNVKKLTPIELVSMARQGFFTEQGIPGSAELISAHHTGKLSAEQLVQAAIRADKLSPHFLKDRNYLNAVDSQLRTLTIR